MNLPRKRVPSEILKRGYSDEELANIYELGRFFLENGDIRRGETVMLGLIEIAPEFAPPWLALSYVHFVNHDIEGAARTATSALKADPEFVEAMLALVAALITQGDFQSAGTWLGEIGERIEGGLADDPRIVRFHKAQLARFQNR